MSNFDTGKIRNIAVVAHGKAGKTSLVEALLFDAGAIDRLGRVDDGTTTTDYEPEEINKKISISTALAFCQWKNHRLNLIDTPGFINLLEDAKAGMKAADGAVVIASASGGIKGETERLWKYADMFKIPRVVFVNKMDREPADFYAAVESLERTFHTDGIPLQVPIGLGEDFKGIVDLLSMKALIYKNGKAEESAIPADVADNANKCRKMLVEKIAEADDALLEKYLEGQELTMDEILNGLRAGVLKRKFVPVVCGSATKNIGVRELLDTVTSFLPSPLDMAELHPIKGKDPKDGSEAVRKPINGDPFSAYVFKTVADPYAGKLSLFRVYSGSLKADSTVYNNTSDTKERIGQIFYLQGKKQNPAQSVGPGEIAVVAKLKATNTGDTLTDEAHKIVFDKVKFEEPIISFAIEPKNKGEEEKVSTALHKILDEDPTIRFTRDEEAQEMLLSGMGQAHLEITLEKLKRKFGVEVLMKAPKIPYRETIRAHTKAQGKYKKQSGGKGQYGDCWIEVEPLPRGAGYEFVNNVVGGAIPRNYIPAVDKGIQEAMKTGIYAGYQMVDVKVTLFDGSYHDVDSSEMAFKIAGSMGIKKAVETAKPVVLEPIMKVDITTPEEYLGAVIGDLNGRRGKVQGMDQMEGGTTQKVAALVPMAEMLTYSNQLHALTSGRGNYHMEFSHYEELPSMLTQKLLDERKKKEEHK